MSDRPRPDDTTPQARVLAEMSDTLVAMGETPAGAPAKVLLILEKRITVGPVRRWGGLQAWPRAQGPLEMARRFPSGRTCAQRTRASETPQVMPEARGNAQEPEGLDIPLSWTLLVEELCRESWRSDRPPNTQKVLH